MLAAGRSNQAIAGELVVTLDTVKKHVGHVLGKLGAANRTEAVARARELSLIPDHQNAAPRTSGRPGEGPAGSASPGRATLQWPMTPRRRGHRGAHFSLARRRAGDRPFGAPGRLAVGLAAARSAAWPTEGSSASCWRMPVLSSATAEDVAAIYPSEVYTARGGQASSTPAICAPATTTSATLAWAIVGDYRALFSRQKGGSGLRRAAEVGRGATGGAFGGVSGAGHVAQPAVQRGGQRD